MAERIIKKSKLFKPLVIDNFENISTDELATMKSTGI